MPAAKPYDADIVSKVCDALVCSDRSIGRALASVKNAPGVTRWYEWLEENETAAKMYARAKESQADFMAGQIVEIADTEADPNRARIRVDARKWVAAKLKPRSYGDKLGLEHTGKDGGPLEFLVKVDRDPGA